MPVRHRQASPRRPRRLASPLLAALTSAIEGVAETAGPVVEATAEAAGGADPVRERERLVVALRNLDAAMTRARAAVRAALDGLEGGRPRPAGRR
jgi:hypothetical protein